MATQPVPTPSDAQMESEAPLTDSPEQQGGAGFTIEIKCGADGTIQVGVESDGQEAAEGGEAGPEEEQYQQCQSIGEAIRLVKEIYSSQGQMQSPAEGQDQMAAGYK